eukprot:341210_1
MASPFIKSIRLPISCNSYIPKPSYDPTNTNCIIISTCHQEARITPGIYRYNIMTNESKIIYKYNNTFNACWHGQFIDTINNTLILYGGNDDTFKIFDLNTNQRKQIN